MTESSAASKEIASDRELKERFEIFRADVEEPSSQTDSFEGKLEESKERRELFLVRVR